MANSKISQLSSLTNDTVDVLDVLPVVDTSASETKKITYQNLLNPKDSVFNIVDNADITKKVAFQVSGVTTGTTRTLTVPDANTTIVGTDATQTLSNKTLTSPQVNFGSDATGDMIYRTSGGVTARLPVGTNDQILAVQSGVPGWIANPSASDASTTVKGVVEIATTAEITAGTSTGATGAILVVPASAVGSAGASKLVQYDGTGKYPAADGSAITNISGSAISDFNYTVNAIESSSTWHTSTITPANAATDARWTFVGTSGFTAYGNAFLQDANTTVTAFTQLAGTSSSTPALTFATTKSIRIKIPYFTANVAGANIKQGWGLGDTLTNFFDNTAVGPRSMRFVMNNATLYAVTSNNSAVTATDITSGITVSNLNIYEIVWTNGVDVKFYVNGVLKATHTTNIPTTGNIRFQGTGNGSGGEACGHVIGMITYSQSI